MEMNYIKFGNGEKTMVILPGLSLKPVSNDSEAVIGAYQMFGDEYTVYLFDQRSDVDEGYTLDDMVNDTVSKIKELGLKDIYLYGVSLGGMLSQAITINHPELVKKLALTSTCSNFNKDNFVEWIDLAKNNKVEDLVNCFCELVYSKDTYEAIKPTLKDYASDVTEGQVHNFVIYAEAAAHGDVSDEIYRINIPVLILGSKKDRIVSESDMLYLNEKITGSEIYLYDGYSHAVYDEAGDIKDRILNFFDK